MTSLQTSLPGLPAVGDSFDQDNLAYLKENLAPHFLSFVRKHNGLDAFASADDLLQQVLLRLARAGPIHTSAIGLVSRVVTNVCNDALHDLQQRRTIFSHSLDQLTWNSEAPTELSAYQISPDERAVEIDAEAETSIITVRTLIWSYPDADPQSAALLALWHSRRGPDAPAWRDLERMFPDHIHRASSLRRKWRDIFDLSGDSLIALDFLLREHPALPITQVHLYHATGALFLPGPSGRRRTNQPSKAARERMALELQKLYRVALEKPSELPDCVRNIQRRAREHSGYPARIWRHTEQAFQHNREVAERYVLRLTELF